MIADGFEELVEREQTAMLRLAVLLVDDRGQAEDVVQDAFLKVSARWELIDNPGGYLRTCVVNACRDVLRRRRTAARPLPVPPSQKVELEAGLAELHDVIGSLPERQQVVLALRYLDGMEDHRIAEVVGCRPATVRSLAQRGLRSMRRKLT